MKKNMFLFLAGGSIYPTLEMAWRGHTHVSMAVAGGLCLCLIDKICNYQLKSRPLFTRCAAGSLIITSVEFAVGVVVNLVLKLDVWNYSALPLNVLGQVCLPFTVLWCLVSLPAMGLCSLCDHSQFLSSPKTVAKVFSLIKTKTA